MDYIKELKKLVKKDVLVEVEGTINELETELERKKNKDLKEELKYMKQVKLYFDEVLIDIENNSITQEEALDILEGLDDMRAENQEL